MFDRMTGRADLLVNLESALQTGPVVGAEDTIKRPFLTRQPWFLLAKAAGGKSRQRNRECREQKLFRHLKLSPAGRRQCRAAPLRPKPVCRCWPAAVWVARVCR